MALVVSDTPKTKKVVQHFGSFVEHLEISIGKKVRII